MAFRLGILLYIHLQSRFDLILLTVGCGNRRGLLSGWSIRSRRDLSLAHRRVTWFRFGLTLGSSSSSQFGWDLFSLSLSCQVDNLISVLVLAIAIVVVGISLLYWLLWL